MGAGLCVLVSDSPESVEALGDSGFTFKGGDVTDLPRALTDLLSDPQYRISTGERARQRVRDNFLRENVVDEAGDDLDVNVQG